MHVPGRSRIFMMGHPEYDRVTLDREYKRDKAKGMDIDLPVNYYPGDDETKKPLLQWRSHGNLLYTNWLNYYVYQKTPYRWPGDLPDGRQKIGFSCEGNSAIIAVSYCRRQVQWQRREEVLR